MATMRRLFGLFLILALITITSLAPLASVTAQQPAPARTTASALDLSASLAAIEKAVDDKRKELGIPGVSLVIVKDDKVIYMKGLGVKDF